jgi:hypothetical protein
MNRAFYQELEIDVEAGRGLSVGRDGAEEVGVDPQMMLQWSDDGGHTWSSELWTSAGKQGQFTRRAVWRRLGSSRDRVFRVTMQDPVPWVLVDAYLYVQVGKS